MTPTERAPSTQVVENATCTYCGCVCDDIRLTLENQRIQQVENACELGQTWFRQHQLDRRPPALIGGDDASLEAAVERATQILVEARNPLIFGLTGITCEAQQAAVAIADRLGATIDTVAADNLEPPTVVFQGTGLSTATLGEVQNRADLVIYWGGSPAETHPRLFTRYAVTPKGMFVPNGRKDRTVVLVDGHGASGGQDADLFVQIKPGSDFEVLWVMRALLSGKKIHPRIEGELGVSIEVLADLVERMKRCTYGVLFYDLRVAATRGCQFNAGAALALVTDMNEFTHFVVVPARSGGNANGAENVLAWQTGFPSSVNYGRGYPRHNPREFSAVDMLVREEADAVLLVNAEATTALTPAARSHLRRIPTVVLNSEATSLGADAEVAITTAAHGLSSSGTVFRMDDVPISLRQILLSIYPSDEEVLRAIQKRVEQQLGRHDGD